MVDTTFTAFLRFTLSQQEVSLALAKDEVEQQTFLRELGQEGFQQVAELLPLMQAVKLPSKIFYVMSSELPQEMYEFLSQYPTKHLSIFDKRLGDFRIASPVYTDVAIVFLITREVLETIEAKGLSIVDKVGLVYQS